MPVTDAVIKQVEEMAVKDGAIKGTDFEDRKGLEYEFDNDKEYEMLVEPDELAPFPDIRCTRYVNQARRGIWNRRCRARRTSDE